MATADERGPGQDAEQDPGHPGHERFPGMDRPEQMPMDAATWHQVRTGHQVVSAAGESLGRVRSKSDYMLVTEMPVGLLKSQEVYVPHMAVTRVEADTVHLHLAKAQLEENHEHYRRYHFNR